MFHAMDGLLLLTADELAREAGLTMPQALGIVGRSQTEMAHLFDNDANRCWLLVLKDRADPNGQVGFRSTISEEQAARLVREVTSATFVAFHAVVHQALARLMLLQNEVAGNA